MSSWPLISHFASMLKNPQVGFRDPELKNCSVEMNQLGQPKARSGNFATVYRGFRPGGGEFAIRVFNRRQDERLQHYRTISQYLEGRRLSSIVQFDYDERGIRSSGDGKLYPLLTMEWVPGITLFEWTRDRCREGYAEALQIGSEVWLHLVRELAEHHVVHGDLQHGNVLVSPEGHFKLVDYDCMCVPELIGRRNLETGLPPYQHPGRNADTILFSGMDNFSSLVIFVALRALAAAPQLWHTYVDQPQYDRILFREEDFRTPALSPLYRDLLNSPDEQVRDLAHYLFELARYNIQDVPPVDEVLLWCESIESLVTAREWDKVVQLVQRMGEHERVPDDLQPLVDEAQQRVACRQEVEQALEQGDEQRVEQLFNSGLLHDYPAAAGLVELASRAGEARAVLRVLASARQLKAWHKLKATWLENQDLLSGRASARVYEREIQKMQLVDRLGELLAAPKVDPVAVLETWDALKNLGGHPLAEPLRESVQQLTVRHHSLERLRVLLNDAPEQPTLAYDKQLLAAASQEVIHGLDPASPLVRKYQAASTRLQCVRRVHELEKVGTVESETFIARVMERLPASYHEGLARRSGQARRRVRSLRRLERAIRAESEGDIDEAWQLLVEVRGRVLASPEIGARAELAQRRLPLLEELRQIPDAAPPEERQRRVLGIWDPELLDGCREAEPWAAIYHSCESIRQDLERLSQAIDNEQLGEAERLLKQSSLAGTQLPDELDARLQELRSRAQQALLANRQAIVNALRENHRSAFVELFDAAVVGDICQQFRHHQIGVRQWVETEILPADRIGFATDPETAVTRDEEGNLRLRWTWPPPRISNQCRLVICKSKPAPHDLPEDVQAQYAASIDRHQWDATAGHVVPSDPEWEGSRVMVWAVVELGFQTFFSEAFEVGMIEPVEAKRRRWALFGAWRSGKAKEQGDDQPPTDADSAEPTEPVAPAEEEPHPEQAQ